MKVFDNDNATFDAVVDDADIHCGEWKLSSK